MGCCGKGGGRRQTALARMRMAGPARPFLGPQTGQFALAPRALVAAPPVRFQVGLPRIQAGLPAGVDIVAPPVAIRSRMPDFVVPPETVGRPSDIGFPSPSGSGRRFARTVRDAPMHAALDNPLVRAKATILAGSLVETFESRRGRAAQLTPPFARKLPIPYVQLERIAYDYTRASFRSGDGSMVTGWIPTDYLQPASIEAPGGLPLTPPPGTGQAQAFLRTVVASPAFDVRALPPPGFDPVRRPGPPPAAPAPPSSNVRFVRFGGRGGAEVAMWMSLNNPSRRGSTPFGRVPRGALVIFDGRTDVQVFGPVPDETRPPRGAYSFVRYGSGTGWILTDELVRSPSEGGLVPVTGGAPLMLLPLTSGWGYAG